jgi:hypothetical protein
MVVQVLLGKEAFHPLQARAPVERIGQVRHGQVLGYLISSQGSESDGDEEAQGILHLTQSSNPLP